jgi:hypothetical protein
MEQGSRNVWEGSLWTATDRLQENLSAAGYARESMVEYIRAARHFCYWYAAHAPLGRAAQVPGELVILMLSQNPHTPAMIPVAGLYLP